MRQMNWAKAGFAGIILFITLVSSVWASVPSTPVFTPAGGTYYNDQEVVITCATSGATIRYSTDGSDPNSGTEIVSGTSVLIDHSLTLQAVAWKDGVPSSLKSASYNLVAATPVFTPADGTYYNDQEVVITCATSGATIRYSTDGSNPNSGTEIVSGASVLINHSLTLQAVAWKDGVPSSLKSASYNFVVATPEFSPDGGRYDIDQEVVITCATPGATIRYTTDGSDPSTGTIIPSGASVIVSVEPQTVLKAQAFLEGWNDSNIKAATYSKGIIYVDLDATGANNGFGWEDAYTDLQSALMAAIEGDEIWVAAGTYYPTNKVGGTTDQYKAFQLKNGVAVYGGFAGTETDRRQRNLAANKTILSGGGTCYHVFHHPDGTDLDNTAVLDGVTIADGCAVVYHHYDTPANAGHGAGMYNDNSSPTVRNCIFSNNYAMSYIDDMGGWWDDGGGGGVYNYRSDPVFINCVFMGNTTNELFTSGNGGGGGMYNDHSSPVLTNCVFTKNVGGGISNCNSSVTITNCIFWNNGVKQIYDDSSVSVVTYSDIEGGYSGTGNISEDPQMVTDPNYVVCTLQAGSPCIDAGNSAAVPDDITTDLAGNPRIMDGNADNNTAVDMGAYEYPKETTVERPVFSVYSGIYYAEQTVIITCASPEATIHYTTNGLDPTESDPTIISGSSIFVDHVLTLKAKAWKENYSPSAVQSATYQLTVSTPVLNPDGGHYLSDQTVVITCATPDVQICYTVDGSDPSSGTVIENGGSVVVTISPITLLQAQAFKPNWNSSGIKSTFYYHYAGGNGTSENPYQIATKADLMVLRTITTDYDKYFILTADIDMEGQTFNAAVIAPDTSTANGFQGTAFTGVFDGAGFKIKNLTISGQANDFIGLFGDVGVSAQIKNLGIEMCSVYGSFRTGGLVGHSSGSISNCYCTGSVSGSSSTGGLVGYSSSSSISNCYSTGPVSGSSYSTGGLVGRSYYSSISNCYSTGSVSGLSDYTGGLVGYSSSSSISNCYSTGSVSGSSSTGGLVGYTYSSTATNSFWDTETSGQTTSAGGTGKTTAEMKTLATFANAGWGFDVPWPMWTTGKTGNALSFDGTNDYVAITDPNYYGIGGTGARSVSLWFKTSTTSQNQALIQWGSDSIGELWLVRIETSGRLVVAVANGGVYSSTIVTDGQWHHVVAVLDEGQTDSAQIRLYMDGVQEAYLTGSTTVNTSQTVPVHLGAWYLYSSGTLTNYFQGLMDEVCIYDRALDASEIVPENPIPTEGLVAHWAMDETKGLIAHDSVSSYDGELKNMTFSTEAVWAICEGTNYPRLLWQIPEGDWVCPDGVNVEDLDYLVGQWLETTCTADNDYCNGVDLDESGAVDMADFAIFAGQWLEE